ncbi:MAG: hypothetical protein WCK34_17980 [Bacteroidota bacterium]
MKKFIILVISVFFVCSVSIAQKMDLKLAEANKMANTSLPTFRKLVNQANFQKMGFRSLAEVKDASLGQPLSFYRIQLDELKNFKPGGDPAMLVHFGDRVFYPIMVNNEIKSSMQMDKSADKWEVSSYGGANRMKLFSDAIARLSANRANAGMEYQVVAIQSMNLYFIGMQKDNKLYLTPVLDDETYGLKAGETVAADALLPRLAEMAAQLKDVPR